MKLLIASDIHGSAYWCRALMAQVEAESPDTVVLLGDLLYHGPRNDLPRDYAPKEVLAMLNTLADRVVAVRGNCDSEVDQMVLPFPVLADYGFLELSGRAVYLTHGHVINKAHPLPFSKGDILLHGHTHVPACEDCGDFMYLNPGSVSIPKENSPHSYMVFESGVFSWKNIETGEVYRTFAL